MAGAHEYVDLIARGLELLGVAIIIFGVLVASAGYINEGVRTRDWRSSYNQYRANLGRGILLGLELLVGADIMSTVTAPLTFASVGLLAGVIAIRTFLSFSLETEIEGCWPWQRSQIERKAGAPEPPGSR